MTKEPLTSHQQASSAVYPCVYGCNACLAWLDARHRYEAPNSEHAPMIGSLLLVSSRLVVQERSA
jgi:hypothetical protein